MILTSWFLTYYLFMYSSSHYMEEVSNTANASETYIRAPLTEQPELDAAVTIDPMDFSAGNKWIFVQQFQRYLMLLVGAWLMHFRILEPLMLIVHILLNEPRIQDVLNI